jgi:hypothetical protein
MQSCGATLPPASVGRLFMITSKWYECCQLQETMSQFAMNGLILVSDSHDRDTVQERGVTKSQCNCEFRGCLTRSASKPQNAQHLWTGGCIKCVSLRPVRLANFRPSDRVDHLSWRKSIWMHTSPGPKPIDQSAFCRICQSDQYAYEILHSRRFQYFCSNHEWRMHDLPNRGAIPNPSHPLKSPQVMQWVRPWNFSWNLFSLYKCSDLRRGRLPYRNYWLSVFAS